ncbi:PREDICTED: uncharacterized protein LOC108563156 [Nicrophorus vespilloides]|uniref:Uncharacterized protein LOC108563156 n=1 Tax=Nicrophorus vespilloides TaxID=110193 RepID=A0ABM1MRP4_NICVS|nr:PREDICTED: uncharacterized protein LOC108563156 [Nicrophorus vespilloides]
MDNEDKVAMESEQSDDEKSDISLKIVEDSPKKKQHHEITPQDKEILSKFETEFEEKLQEKAEKNKLTTFNVKRILKDVVTNEHVIALVRKANNPDENIPLQFEPKLTRSTAKKLFKTQPVNVWSSKNSETQVLISEELNEDSSGDEYIPTYESEDDRESSVASNDVGSPKNKCIKTAWSEDGIFKVPHKKTAEEIEEEANIARRTRSKLSLSDKSLEFLAESFVPPDIPPDWLPVDCDDEYWAQFLTEFTKPLDEVSKIEDEDHDPEYNVLADEEIDKVDKEELRADKGVKVSKKELNALISELAELGDYAYNYEIEQQRKQQYIEQSANLSISESESIVMVRPSLNDELVNAKVTILPENFEAFDDHQYPLLQQQMRQHVQMLTQCFLLTYEHPEFNTLSSNCTESLNELLQASNGNDKSFFNSTNLLSALSLIKQWEAKFETNDAEVVQYKDHVMRIICETRQAKKSGITYIPTFPRYLLQTVCNSDVFLYPMLLPRIPFKPSNTFGRRLFIIESEAELIAHGLEQFLPFMKFQKNHLNSKGEVRLIDASNYISKYLMPHLSARKIYRYILVHKKSKFKNPIKQFFEKNRSTPPLHYVAPLDQFMILPPCQRSMEQLPHQWREFLYPHSKISKHTKALIISPLFVTSPEPSTKDFFKKRKIENSTLISPQKRKRTDENSYVQSEVLISSLEPVEKAKFSTTIFSFSITKNVLKNNVNLNTSKLMEKASANKLVYTSIKHVYLACDLLEVVFKCSILIKIMPVDENEGVFTELFSEKLDDKVSFQNAKLNDMKLEIMLKEDVQDSDKKVVEVEEPVKDNLDDINALMVASTTIKSSEGRRKPTGAEKKRAKLRRDYNATLRMLIPEEEDVVAEKTERFVQAFYDKVRERLDLHEYHRFMEVLNNFDEMYDSVTDLYNKIENIISDKHPDILDEFLTFFTSLQAKSIGKLIPHLVMNNMALFLHKLEMIFKDQPSQVRKIYRCLTELVAMQNVSMDHVKSTILPLLKGNNLLIDWFLQIFPTEKPPERLMRGSWEKMEMTNDDHYEMITIPDVEDPYGGPTCICQCHNVEDQIFKSRSKHCVPCGTKFMQGRVYVQTSRGLRLAKVIFEDNNVDHSARLACKVKTKRRESPVKQISPGKDSQCSSDDEPDKKRVLKTPKKRKPKKITPKVEAGCSKQVLEEKEVVEEKDVQAEVPQVEQMNGNTSDSSINEIKIPVEENVEWDCNTSIESIELKMSAESESDFCEETSQDNNSDSMGSESEPNSPTFPEIQWAREEDKIILEMFQKETDKDVAFQRIANVLQNRSIAQIKQRFETLMILLREMTKNNKV